MPIGRTAPDAPAPRQGSPVKLRAQTPLRVSERDGETIIGIDLPPAPVVPTAAEVAALVPVPVVPTVQDLLVAVERARPPAPLVRDVPAWVWRLEDMRAAGAQGFFRIDADGNLIPVTLEAGEGIGLVDDPGGTVIRIQAMALAKRVAALEELCRTLSSTSSTEGSRDRTTSEPA